MTVKQLLDAYVSDYPGTHEADLLARVVIAEFRGRTEQDVECAQNVDALRSKAHLIASKIVRANDRAAAEKRAQAKRVADYEKSKRDAAEAALNATLEVAQPSQSMFCDAASNARGFRSRCSNKAKHSIVVDTATGVRADLCGLHTKKFAVEPYRVSFTGSTYKRINEAQAALEALNAQIEADRAEAEANAKGYSTLI